MKMEINIPEFNIEKGITYEWTDGFEISVKVKGQVVSITANREGLISLANHFLNLAQEKIPKGHHMHFDEYNSLDTGSYELIISKK